MYKKAFLYAKIFAIFLVLGFAYTNCSEQDKFESDAKTSSSSGSDDEDVKPLNCTFPAGDHNEVRSASDCADGFIGTISYQCVNGNWNTTNIYCVPEGSEPVTTCTEENGDIFQAGDTKNSECAADESGEIIVTCLGNNSWSSPINTCTSIPEGAETCEHEGINYLVGQSRPDESCGTGYSGSLSYSCLSENTWSEPIFSEHCIAVTTPECTSGQTQTDPCPSSPLGNPGTTTRTCQNDGTWSDYGTCVADQEYFCSNTEDFTDPNLSYENSSVIDVNVCPDDSEGNPQTGSISYTCMHNEDNDDSTWVPTESCEPYEQPVVVNCPTNDEWIKVPPRNGYNQHEFCVMKYEAKKHSDEPPLRSTANKQPWTEFTRNQAISACQSLGDGYDLISNSEWQSIALNIAEVSSNWYDMGNGVKVINKGHSDNHPAEACRAGEGRELVGGSSANGSCGINAVDEATATEAEKEQLRTHTLSNGEIIWDISGNVMEWVKDDISTSGVTDGTSIFVSQLDSSNSSHATAINLFGFGTFISSELSSLLLNSQSGGIPNYYGVGRIQQGHIKPEPTIRRGGTYDNVNDKGELITAQIGILNANLNGSLTTSNTKTGFRCVYRGPTPGAPPAD